MYCLSSVINKRNWRVYREEEISITCENILYVKNKCSDELRGTKQDRKKKILNVGEL